MNPSVKEWSAALVGLLEKAFSTWLQAFIVALVGSTFFESLDLSILASAAVATVPAMITVLLAAVQGAREPDWPLGQLILWRAVRTAGAIFLGVLVEAQWVMNLGSVKAIFVAAAAAALGAFLAAIKGALASLVGNPDSPAVVPARFAVAA